jgi:hypothetical protein
MKTENETSGSRTATTPASGHESKPDEKNSKPAPKPGEPAPTNDESAFLAQQAADAKAAISATIADIGKNLGQAVNVNQLTRQHPWLTIGASTVAGFVATAMLVPSKEDRALKKLAKIERALTPPPPEAKRDETNGDGAQDYKKGKQSFGRTILGEVIKTIQPALLSMLTAGVTAQATKPSQEEMQAAAAAEDNKQGEP